MRILSAGIVLVLLGALARAQDNVLIVVTDDIGVDQLACYGQGSDLPPTPNLSALAANGVLFRNAYSNPVCSPTRALVLTGRQAHRTGIGHIVGPEMASPEFFQLPLEEITLPEMLDLGTGGLYQHAAIGKWHLYEGFGFETAANDAGFGHFAGTPANLGFSPAAYYNWPKLVDGTLSVSTKYATTDQVDEALAFVATAHEPWLCYLAFSAAHTPYHAPPPSLHTQDLSTAGPPASDPRPYYKATVEAVDTELGRLFAGMGPLLARTNVFFLADNGTPFGVVVPPFDPDHAKSTLYDGGVHVPLIAAGPAVAQPGVCDALVSMTDLFATVAELAGVDLATVMPPGFELDSTSLVPYLADPSAPSRRATVFSEIFAPIGSAPYEYWGYMLRDERYKLIRVFEPGLPGYPAAFHDLWNDPHEQTNLLVTGLTPAELDRYRALERESALIVRRARLAGPSGSQSRVITAATVDAGGGKSGSVSYRVVSQVGQAPAGRAIGSTTMRAVSGVTATTGGFAASEPVFFGFGDARGDKAGGETTTLFGLGLNALGAGSGAELRIGGVKVHGLTVLADTHAKLTTPPGFNSLGNPAGAETLGLISASAVLVRPSYYTYLPALELQSEPKVGGLFNLRVAVNPGDTYALFFGHGASATGIAVPPIGGLLEIPSPVKLKMPALSIGGEERVVVSFPDDPTMVGLALDLQGLAGPLFDATKLAWTNRLRLVLEPQL